jgi:hypothetical protein
MTLRTRVILAVLTLPTLATVLVVHETLRHKLVWFVDSASSVVLANGKPTEASVIKGECIYGDNRCVIVTTRGTQPRSYLVALPGPEEGGVSDCLGWVAPRWPAVPIAADAHPPCWGFGRPESEPKRDLVVDSRGFEFTANDGSRITVRW